MAKLFEWNSESIWMKDIQKYASDILTKTVVAELTKASPECWSDNFDWLPVSQGNQKFTDAFAGYYSHVLGFHGCRPSNFSNYFRDGAKGQAADEIEEKFFRLFDDVSPALLKQAASALAMRKES